MSFGTIVSSPEHTSFDEGLRSELMRIVENGSLALLTRRAIIQPFKFD